MANKRTYKELESELLATQLEIEKIKNSRNTSQTVPNGNRSCDLLQDNPSILLFSINKDFQINYCNSVKSGIYKLGTNFLEYTDNERNKESFRKNIETALKGNASTTLQYFGENTKLYECIFNPSTNNKIISVTIVLIAISDRAAEIDFLFEEKAKYKAMMENVTDIISIIDKDGITRFKSPNAEKLLGWKVEELVGKPALKNIHPEDQKILISGFEALINGEKEKFTAEFRYLKKDLSYTWVEFSAVNNIDTPYLNGILVNYHDISDRKIANQALLQSETRYRMLFTNMDDSSSLYEVIEDDQGEAIDYRFIAVNPVFEESIGYTNDFLKGKTLLDVFPKAEQVWLDAFKKAHKTGKSQKVIDYTKVLDMYFEIIAFIPQKGLLSMIGVDITDRKKNEIRELENKQNLKEQNEEYLAINEELCERNEEYSILNDQYKEQNEALFIAMEKAEESDLLKSTFLQIMSHEIRTPMNAIYGFSELLLESNPEEDIFKEYSTIIKNSSEQLLSIVTDVLTVSALRTNQEQVCLNNVCINQLLDELVKVCVAQAKNKKATISISKSLDETTSCIKTDKTKLTQILSNLIGNAIKFSENGKVEIDYRLKGDYMLFKVQDSGIGIKKEEQQGIFDQFRQANHTIQKQYGGTGLGLTISKAFVELLGGEIWFESEENKGTCFYFTIALQADV